MLAPKTAPSRYVSSLVITAIAHKSPSLVHPAPSCDLPVSVPSTESFPAALAICIYLSLLSYLSIYLNILLVYRITDVGMCIVVRFLDCRQSIINAIRCLCNGSTDRQHCHVFVTFAPVAVTCETLHNADAFWQSCSLLKACSTLHVAGSLCA